MNTLGTALARLRGCVFLLLDAPGETDADEGEPEDVDGAVDEEGAARAAGGGGDEGGEGLGAGEAEDPVGGGHHGHAQGARLGGDQLHGNLPNR